MEKFVILLRLIIDLLENLVFITLTKKKRAKVRLKTLKIYKI